MGLLKDFCTLGDGVVMSGTLVYEGMSDSVCGGDIGIGLVNLGYVCSFLRTVVCVKSSGCSVGAVVWAVGAWILIRMLSAVASRLKYLIDVSPFPFDKTFVDCSRLRMALIM